MWAESEARWWSRADRSSMLTYVPKSPLHSINKVNFISPEKNTIPFVGAKNSKVCRIVKKASFTMQYAMPSPPLPSLDNFSRGRMLLNIAPALLAIISRFRLWESDCWAVLPAGPFWSHACLPSDIDENKNTVMLNHTLSAQTARLAATTSREFQQCKFLSSIFWLWTQDYIEELIRRLQVLLSSQSTLTTLLRYHLMVTKPKVPLCSSMECCEFWRAYHQDFSRSTSSEGSNGTGTLYRRSFRASWMHRSMLWSVPGLSENLVNEHLFHRICVTTERLRMQSPWITSIWLQMSYTLSGNLVCRI